jgi:tRNA-(ms[2]io[6]A)-hydroxylase
MLHLASVTDPDWADRARASLDLILLDHAHCEKKAASTAVNLIFRYPEHPSLMRPLAELAREELDHFRQVLDVLDARGIGFRRLPPSPYAARLTEIVRRTEPERLLDMLLVAAMIEARSCERMQLLAERLEDPRLAAFYASLLASEARHHRSYLDLAESIVLPDTVLARLAEVARHEAEVIGAAPVEPRLHNG